MLMYKIDGGFCDFPVGQAPAGWVPGQPIWDAAMAAKRGDVAPIAKPIAKPVETVTLTAQPDIRRPGRPRNVAPSILNDGSNGEV